eukprot:90749-Lingulodinium_polyedra.AAC.1
MVRSCCSGGCQRKNIFTSPSADQHASHHYQQTSMNHHHQMSRPGSATSPPTPACTTIKPQLHASPFKEAYQQTSMHDHLHQHA